ncbi:hypothetical protein HOY80DRAFT_1003106 [Tuber brumale]|nr:hypothetical protein HOY80DRAFT_1003106 [Tuber brumale]
MLSISRRLLSRPYFKMRLAVQRILCFYAPCAYGTGLFVPGVLRSSERVPYVFDRQKGVQMRDNQTTGGGGTIVYEYNICKIQISKGKKKILATLATLQDRRDTSTSNDTSIGMGEEDTGTVWRRGHRQQPSGQMGAKSAANNCRFTSFREFDVAALSVVLECSSTGTRTRRLPLGRRGLQPSVLSCSQPEGACRLRSHDKAKEKGDKPRRPRHAKLQLSFKMPSTLTLSETGSKIRNPRSQSSQPYHTPKGRLSRAPVSLIRGVPTAPSEASNIVDTVRVLEYCRMRLLPLFH